MPSLASAESVAATSLDLPDRRCGKVRDLYRLPIDPDGRPRVLVVATDRVSAFDVVLPDAAPGKGRLLTEISLWWFRRLRHEGIVADHILHADIDAVPEIRQQDRESLRGRIMVCRAAQIVPIECVARSHLAGSGWAEYRRDGTVCGLRLPAGLRPGDALPEPIFTPATKAAEGHDENVSFEQAAAIAGGELLERLRGATLELFRRAARIGAAKGLVLADTKFEFGFALDGDGRPTDELLLVDEILTPDSSRWWPADEVGQGRVPSGFDKQPLRDWLQAEADSGRWDKSPPGPAIPVEVQQALLDRYRSLRDRLLGHRGSS